MNVYFKDGNVATKNLTPGISVYGEELVQEDEEYRIWNPRRSKLSAALLNGLENLKLWVTCYNVHYDHRKIIKICKIP